MRKSIHSRLHWVGKAGITHSGDNLLFLGLNTAPDRHTAENRCKAIEVQSSLKKETLNVRYPSGLSAIVDR